MNKSDSTQASVIGQNVSVLRRSRGLSQEELAERVGCSRSQLARLESGVSCRPSYQIVAYIARALGVTTQQLEQSGSDRQRA